MTGVSEKKQIKQGGYQIINGRENNVKLDVPRLWFPDIQKFQMAVDMAKRWDYPRRKELYDLYDSAMMDAHLKGVVRKRRTAMSQFPIEFRRNNKPVDEVNRIVRAPWFRDFRKSLLDVQLYGFHAYQFLPKNGWVEFTEIDHRHINPITREVLEYSSDLNGQPLDSFPYTLFLGKQEEIGELANVLPWIITKRQTTGDWAQYAQLFGMPIREYTYDGADRETLLALKEEAECQGSNGIYFHTTDTNMHILEPSNRSGSSELYERLMDKCDEQISILLLGNTLTTTVGDSGSRALGDVQKSEEEAIMEDDRQYVLDVLNYEMSDIFMTMGINTEGGEWCYVKQEKIDATAQADIVVKMNQLGLPISDDYLYETFGIEKPADYEKLVKEKEAQKAAMQKAMEEAGKATNQPAEPDKKARTGIAKRILDFFASARKEAGSQDTLSMKW